MIWILTVVALATGIVWGAILMFLVVVWDYRTLQRAARRRAVFGAATREHA